MLQRVLMKAVKSPGAIGSVGQLVVVWRKRYTKPLEGRDCIVFNDVILVEQIGSKYLQSGILQWNSLFSYVISG